MEIPAQHNQTPLAANLAEKLPTERSSKTVLKIVGWSIIALLIGSAITFGTLINISQTSLPGQSMYKFKTNIAEKFIRATKVTAASRVQYDTTLLEQRLSELTTIAADQGTTSPELIAQIASLADTHARNAMTVLEKNQSLSDETRITTLAKLDTVVRGAETLSDSTQELESINDAVGKTEDDLNLALATAIGTFITDNATDTVESFIASQISEVSTHIAEVAPGSRAQGLVIRRISDTNEAIIDGKYDDAITAIIRAGQAIAVDGYLFDGERGPVNGIEIEAGPAPEGN